jgi:glycosyltransferase involved in cell wall biosynthesis
MIHHNAILIGCLKTGGAESAVRNIILSLDAHYRANTCIILIRDPDAPEYAAKLGVRVYNLQANTIFSAAWKLRRHIRENHIGCIHAHLVQSILVAALAGFGLSTKLVFFLHTYGRWKQSPDGKGRLKIWCERLAVNHAASAIVYVSERIRALHKSRLMYRDDIAVVIPNIVCRKFENTPPPPPPLRIVSVGRVEQVKGFDWVLEAVRYDTIFADMQWTIVGDGSYRQELEHKAGHLRRNNLKFAGNHPDISPFLKDAHIFFMPSLSEGLPMALLEACKAGIPMIATDVGSISEIIEDGRNGFLIPVGDTHKLEFAFSQLRTPDIRKRMSMEAKNVFSECYDPASLVEKIEALMI